MNFTDTIYNGVLFSEVCANLLRENRDLIKEEEIVDSNGRKKTTLVLLSTETSVKSLAQVLHNYKICLFACHKIPLMKDFTRYIAEDFIYGNISLPKLLYHKFKVQESLLLKSVEKSQHQFGHKSNRRSRSHSPPRNRNKNINLQYSDASVSSKNAKKSVRATSTPPAGLRFRQTREIKYVGRQKVTIAGDGDQKDRNPKETKLQYHERLVKDHFNTVLHPSNRFSTSSNLKQVAGSPLSKSRNWTKDTKHENHSSSPLPSVDHKRVSFSDTRRKSPKRSDAKSNDTSTDSCSSSDKVHQLSSTELFENVVANANKECAIRRGASPPDRNVISKHRHCKRKKGAGSGIHSNNSPTSTTECMSPCAKDDREEAKNVFAGKVGSTSNIIDFQFGSNKSKIIPVKHQYTCHQRSYKDYLPHSPRLNPKRSIVWYPPKLSQAEQVTASKDTFPVISVPQQQAVRKWLTALGLVIRDGEGGFLTRIDAPSSTPAAMLADDRLRNGELLCDLFMILEANAGIHSQLTNLVHRRPATIAKASENIERACWLFRIKACPPIPLKYLTHPKEILIGNKSILWGLLWEIVQAVPLYTDSQLQENPFGFSVPQAPGNSTNTAPGVVSTSSTVVSGVSLDSVNFAPAKPSAASVAASDLYVTTKPRLSSIVAPFSYYPTTASRSAKPSSTGGNIALARSPVLPYTPEERRRLDMSLVQWLYDKSYIIQPLLGDMAVPGTILALEGPLRDGTLLCQLTDLILKEKHIQSYPSDDNVVLSHSNQTKSLIPGWNKKPLSHAQYIANLKKCTALYRKCKNMGVRYLHSGIEEDIVRGDWNAILGLLEDIHRFDDQIPPRPATSTIQSGPAAISSSNTLVELPYLGDSYDKFIERQNTLQVPNNEATRAANPIYDFFPESTAPGVPSGNVASDNHSSFNNVDGVWKRKSDLDVFPSAVSLAQDSSIGVGIGAEWGNQNECIASEGFTSAFAEDLDAKLVSSGHDGGNELNCNSNFNLPNKPDLAPGNEFISAGASGGAGFRSKISEILPIQSDANMPYAKDSHLFSSASPSKLRVAAATARRFINERTPAQEKEYHYTYHGNYEMSREEQEAFLATPLKPSTLNKLTNSGRIHNNVYDESASVHSSGGSKLSSMQGRGDVEDSWLEDGSYLQGNESEVESEVENASERVASEKENCSRNTHANVNLKTKSTSESMNKSSGKPLKNRNVGTGNQISLSTSEIVSTLADAIRVTEDQQNAYSKEFPGKKEVAMKKSKSKSPIQTLIFQKQYRDAVVISDWLKTHYSLEIIPNYILKTMSIDPSCTDDAIQYGKLMYDALSSLHDGVLLCQLVNKINKYEEKIPGTTSTPKNRAQKMQNIRKALNALVTNNKQLSTSWFLIKENEIISGNCTIILEILTKIKYEFHDKKCKKNSPV